jgi:hypothetical protein
LKPRTPPISGIRLSRAMRSWSKSVILGKRQWSRLFRKENGFFRGFEVRGIYYIRILWEKPSYKF